MTTSSSARLPGWPRLSIITPTLNQANFIEQTIRSVLDQNYPNLEYIIVDGGSQDGTIETIRKYESRLACWISEPDRGQSEALNKGIARATGDYIAYINSDDWYCPGAFAAAVQKFVTHPEARWIAGGVIYCYSEDEVVQTLPATDSTLAECLGQKPRSGIVQPGTFWHREVFEKVGRFNEDLHYQFDHEFFVRSMVAGYRCGILDRPIAYYRLHRASKTVSQQPGFLREDWEIYRRFRQHLDSSGRREAESLLWRFEENILLETIYGLLEDGARWQALCYLLPRMRAAFALQPRRLLWGALVRLLFTGRPPAWFVEERHRYG